ncbi:MAG: transketolase [Clostridia bacterium]
MGKVEELKYISKKIRTDVINMIYSAGSGHPGGSLSCVDILVCLYHNIMNLNVDKDGKRIDKFILSKGHAAPAYYATLASAGFIDRNDLNSLRKINSYLEGHPSNKINGVDVSSGSLGQGLSIANGMALAKKISNQEGYVYCLVGDGELEEGQIWEALMSASKYMLSNVILFVDNNRLQIDGDIKDVKNVDKLKEKFESFGFYVQNIDGHNYNEIIDSVQNAKNSTLPNCIIASTIKGKGISFMENQVSWHGKALNEDEYKTAISQLS